MSEPTFVSKINLHNVYRIHEESHNQRLTFFIGYFCKECYFFFLTRVFYFYSLYEIAFNILTIFYEFDKYTFFLKYILILADSNLKIKFLN